MPAFKVDKKDPKKRNYDKIKADLGQPKLHFFTECEMPTFSEIVSSVTTFLADYQIFLAAGAVIGLSIWAATKFVRAGR